MKGRRQPHLQMLNQHMARLGVIGALRSATEIDLHMKSREAIWRQIAWSVVCGRNKFNQQVRARLKSGTDFETLRNGASITAYFGVDVVAGGIGRAMSVLNKL